MDVSEDADHAVLPGGDGWVPGTAGAALAAVRAGLGWLARADAPLSPRSVRRVQDTLLRYAADVLSGPAGLAAFLRTEILATDFPAPRWPGGFPASASLPLDTGTPTALWNLVLLCSFHHLIVIHRRGWKLVLNADGTTTATSPDGIRTLHSHGPPAVAA